MIDFDFIFIGAGLSGLTLAQEVSKSVGRKLALIDPRQDHQRDHIWCCWNNVQAELDLPFEKIWHKWQVRHRSESYICQTSAYPYSCIFSETFYKTCLSKPEESDCSSFFLGESVKLTSFTADMVTVETERRSMTGRFLLDSRPVQPHNALKQDFYGLLVRTSESVFDDSCVTLMDFTDLKSARNGFHFFYVLPFSGQEALIESVFVSKARLDTTEHRQLVSDYLAKEYGVTSFIEKRREHGCIPMHAVAEKPEDKRHYLVGTRGGLVRPSTGYAFAAINSYSKELAASFDKEEFPVPPTALSTKSRLLDSVLLKYLMQRPFDGPALLSALFKNVDPDVLVRFLCDRSSAIDDTAVFAAMPRKLELGLLMLKSQF